MTDLTVILPFHDYPHYLKEALRSLKESQFSDFKVLLVLDHPLVDVKPILEDFSDLDLKVIQLEEKKGTAACRNAGIRACETNYLYFLDSDECSNARRGRTDHADEGGNTVDDLGVLLHEISGLHQKIGTNAVGLP